MNLQSRIFVLPVLPLVAAAAMFGGCGRSTTPGPKAVAVVGQRVLLIDELQQEIDWRQKARRSVPEPRVLLEEMVQQETLIQQARAAGLENEPDFQRSYRALLASKWKERTFTSRSRALEVSEEELRGAFEKQLERYTQPAKARLALIQMKTDVKMSETQLAELRARMDDARAQALDLPPGELGFGKVAASFSEDQASRYKGGDVGWFDAGQTHYRWPAEIVAAGFALPEAGQVSEVLRATNGFYLVKKLDTRVGSVTPQAQVAEALRRRLLAEKRERLEKAFLDEARQAAGVQLFPDVLATLPAPATTVALRQAQERARRASDEPPTLP